MHTTRTLRGLRPHDVLAVWMAVAVSCAGTIAMAEEPRPFWQAPNDAQVTVKHVTGELSLIKPTSINLVYQRDDKKGMDYEMVLPLSKQVRLLYKRSLDELRIGDTVRVTYEERIWADDDLKRAQRTAVEIQFLRPATSGLRSG